MIHGDELDACQCCAMLAVNGDDSGCRGHDHPAPSMSLDYVLSHDDEAPHGFTCGACGTDQGAYAPRFTFVELLPEPAHVNYPHEPGRLFDCPACDARCHCVAGALECVYEGEHNGAGGAA